MDANDWLKMVEKKLQVVQCNNREKVLLASHQLIGHASDWWDAYVEAHEELENINWNEFKMAFRSHHVLQGVIKLKKKEFQDLKQGSMMVSKYVTHFQSPTVPDAPRAGDAPTCLVSAPPSVHRGPEPRRRSTAPWIRSTGFSVGEKFRNLINPMNLTPSTLNLL
jgi:hypothetical protein